MAAPARRRISLTQQAIRLQTVYPHVERPLVQRGRLLWAVASRGAVQERRAGRPFLVGKHFAVGDATVVVDRDVHEVPAGSATAGSVGAQAVDTPAATFGDPAEFLHVHVQQGTRVTVLVTQVGELAAADDLASDSIHVAESGQPLASQTTPIVDAGIPSIPDSATGPAKCFSRALVIRAATSLLVRRGLECGRDDLSARPATPST